MPIRVPRKICTIYKRTEEEKKVHAMGRELEETKSKLASTTKELDSTKKQLSNLSKRLDALESSNTSSK